MFPKISVIMSTYNESVSELKKAIESILNQNYKEFEFIILLDNPNNKLHVKIINNYAMIDDRIVFVINEDNIGLAATLNKGIMLSKGEYIARMDADDISDKMRLDKELQYLEQHRNIDIVSTNKLDIDENDNIINVPSNLPANDEKIKKILMTTSIICHSGVMFRKNRIMEIGCYRLFPTSQDYDLWLRASYYNLNFAIINEKLIKYRIRQNNISNTNPLKQYLIKCYIQKLYYKRKKRGNDDFSLDKLEKFLKKNKVYEEKQIKKFKNTLLYINDLKYLIKNKKYFKSLGLLIKTFFSHRIAKKLLYEYFKCYLLKVV